MKLLLTSAGITNNSIKHALETLLNKPISEASLLYIPTAAMVEEGDKQWLVDELHSVHSLRFRQFDILDIAGVPSDVTVTRVTEADAVMLGGGNTYHLLYTINDRGLRDVFREIAQEKVYIGVSAGSMIVSHRLDLSTSARLYSETMGEVTINEGLGLVDFSIRPHLNSPYFPLITRDRITDIVSSLDNEVYVIDDNSAVLVDGENIEVISEGEWILVG